MTSGYLLKPLRTLEQAQRDITYRNAATHPHPCPQCKRRFARVRDLEQHQAMKHGDAA